MAFVRSASERERRVIVALHFGEGAASVALEDEAVVDGSDLLTRDVVFDPDTGTVDVDSVVVLEVESASE